MDQRKRSKAISAPAGGPATQRPGHLELAFAGGFWVIIRVCNPPPDDDTPGLIMAQRVKHGSSPPTQGDGVAVGPWIEVFLPPCVPYEAVEWLVFPLLDAELNVLTELNEEALAAESLGLAPYPVRVQLDEGQPTLQGQFWMPVNVEHADETADTSEGQGM